jgi:hypothetical protein
MTLIATIALVLGAACLGYFAGCSRVQVVKAQRDALADDLDKLAGLPPRSRRSRGKAKQAHTTHRLKMEMGR